jgi:hypothetical protein
VRPMAGRRGAPARSLSAVFGGPHDAGWRENSDMRYDPSTGPDPTEWRELDEQERIAVVKRYHKRADVRVPNMRLHAIAHAVVEAQLAEGHAPACGRARSSLRKGTLQLAMLSVDSRLAVWTDTRPSMLSGQFSCGMCSR